MLFLVAFKLQIVVLRKRLTNQTTKKRKRGFFLFFAGSHKSSSIRTAYESIGYENDDICIIWLKMMKSNRFESVQIPSDMIDDLTLLFSLKKNSNSTQIDNIFIGFHLLSSSFPSWFLLSLIILSPK